LRLALAFMFQSTDPSTDTRFKSFKRNLKNQGIGRMMIEGAAYLRYTVMSHLRFLQRCPGPVRSFFQTPTAAYAAL